MKTALSIFFYTIIFAFLGALAIGFAFHIVDIRDVVFQVVRFYEDAYLRLLTGLSGFILILLSFAAAQAITGKMQREKTIAFNNPNGQVTVTLSAVEDLIKRLAQQMTEIKDAKADVRAHKKGIDIGMRVVLAQETSIPDFTSRLQELIAAKVQDVFGIDETIAVKIHVAKIVSREEKNCKRRPEPPPEDISIPYQGIKI